MMVASVHLLKRRKWVLFEADPANIEVHSVDRRRDVRVNLRRPVRLMSRADERSMRAQLRDLSCSGAFIDTDARLPEGTCIALGFYVDDGNTRTAVLAKAAVVRCEPCQARRGVAVRFVRIGSEGRRAIHRVVRAQTAAAL